MIDCSAHGPLLVCDGFHVGRFFVPPFEVGHGEIVKLTFQNEWPVALNDVVSAFCRAADYGCHVHASGTVVPVELAMNRSFLREMFHRQTAAEWLTETTGMSRQDAEGQLRIVGVPPDAPISTLAGNPRWLIGFVAAKAVRPTAVVFRSTGLDPIGIQRGLAIADEQLHDCAGVYLTCFPDLAIQEPEYSAVLQVTCAEKESIT